MKDNLRKKLGIEHSLDRELDEVRCILASDEPDDLKFRSIKIILRELSEKITDARINAVFESRTGLLSAKFGEEALIREIEQSKRTGERFAVAFLDIDHLKYINDTFGHVLGTKIIIEVAQALKGGARKYDILCRYGGDEFLAIFPNTTKEKAKKVIERIINDIEKKVFEKEARVSISFGVIECCEFEKATIRGILREVDKELYRAKQNRVNVNLK